MADLTTAQLTDYLRNIAELESSVYRQEEAKEHTERIMEQHYRPEKNKIPKPNCDAVINLGDEPHVPPKPQKPTVKTQAIWIIVILIAVVAALLFGHRALEAAGSDDWLDGFIMCVVWGGLCMFAGCFAGILLITFSPTKMYQTELQAYEEACAARDAYRKKRPAAEKRDQQKRLQYQNALAAEEVRYQAAVTQDQAAVAAAQQEVLKLDAPLQGTQALLTRYYDLNIIFPKYRSMVAMTTIYEYFASGRCSELTGPDGAYNLYEAELRQDLIINKLDVIIRQLDQIKQNQYMLYQEMRQTRSVIQDIGTDVKGILENTSDIATSSHITALCSQVTAQNTEAIQYLTLLNG